MRFMSVCRFASAYTVVLSLGVAAGITRAQASFTTLPILFDNLDDVRPAAISADGNTVVGSINWRNDGPRAFIWSRTTNIIQNLGSPNPVANFSFARDVSADGSVVALEEVAGIRWTQASGRQPITFGQGGFRMNNDGNTFLHGNTLWRNGLPNVIIPTDAPGRTFISADLSGDGQIAIGTSLDASSAFSTAVRWTAATGTQSLGGLPGVSTSFATAISSDGSTIIGRSGDRAFRWTQTTGMQPLSTLSPFLEPLAINADGSVVVGNGFNPANGDMGFVWTAATDRIGIRQLLTQNGIDLTNWSALSVAAVSADGLTFTGRGIVPFGNATRARGWIATIPSPAGLLVLAPALLAPVRRRRGKC